MKTDLKTYNELTQSGGMGAIGWGVVLGVLYAAVSIALEAVRSQPQELSPVEASEIIASRIAPSSSRPRPADLDQSGTSPKADMGGWRKVTFSCYSDYYHGRKAADGSRFSQNGYTVACNDVPLGSRLEVQAKSGNTTTTLQVKVTDRLAKRFSGKRIDLSAQVWKLLSNGKKPGLLKGMWRRVK